MNHLAHTYLSYGDPESLIINLYLDFLKMKEVKMIQPPYTKGVQLHRWIDEYTDTHPVVLGLNKALSVEFGRYASVATDIYFDFFLARKWDMFSETPFEVYCEETYKIIQEQKYVLPARLLPQVDAMIRDRWLHSFEGLAGMVYTFESLSRRASFPNKFADGPTIWENRFFEIEAAFMEFFPELAGYIKLRWEEL